MASRADPNTKASRPNSEVRLLGPIHGRLEGTTSMCAATPRDKSHSGKLLFGQITGRRRVTTMTKLFPRANRTEAQAFLEEVYPFPVTVIAIASLLVGNIAVTLAAVAALG
jgi:hypothetical protein